MLSFDPSGLSKMSIAQRSASERRHEERFWKKVEKTETCWIWTGCKSNGYGNLRRQGKGFLAHRVSYEMAKGVIPDELVLDHLCRNPACVNPDHLEAVPMLVNTLRGRMVEVTKARKAAITHCPYGHPYSGENLRLNRNGSRRCAACGRQRARDQRKKKADAIH